jgi:hypothetical protein
MGTKTERKTQKKIYKVIMSYTRNLLIKGHVHHHYVETGVLIPILKKIMPYAPVGSRSCQ